MEEHSLVCLKDILVKLQAMQKCSSMTLQVYLHEALQIHFYMVPAIHEEVAQRIPNDSWLITSQKGNDICLH